MCKIFPMILLSIDDMAPVSEHETTVGASQQTPLQISISTCSCVPATPRDAFRFFYGLEGYMQNAVVAVRDMLTQSGVLPEEFGVSLHPTLTMRVPLMAALLQQEGVNITSVDTPDVKPFRHTLKDIGKALLSGNLPLVRDHVGWALLCIRDENARIASVKESLDAIKDKEKVIRTSSAYFNEENLRTTGSKLIEKAEKTNSIIAIEIDPSAHSVDAYFNLIRSLRKEHGDIIKISFDAANVERRLVFERSSGISSRFQSAEQIFRALLGDLEKSGISDLGGAVASVELNQLDNDIETKCESGKIPQGHGGPLRGLIDYEAIVRIYGRAIRDGKGDGARVILEFHPAHMQIVLRDGPNYFSALLRAFRGEVAVEG